MILDLIELKNKYSMKITGVIHIGAHFGEEHSTYKSLGVDDIVYFEPVRKTFNVLKERVKDSILFNCALGSENKPIEMHVEASDSFGCSSVLTPSSNYDDVEFGPNEIVEMKRLDDFNFTKYNFLNIDVQGYEFEVLKGSLNTLNYVDYIICEINRETSLKKMDYINTTPIEKIIEILKPYGFNIVEENWAGISWGDGFFIKQK